MFKKILAGCALVLTFGLTQAQAADVKDSFPVEPAMQLEQVKELFDGDIQFYWGSQPHPAIVKTYGTFKTSKRTNALGKSREMACDWAMASSLVALRDRARREGANAVVNIVSNIKNLEESSDTNFSCLMGSVMVNVALKGTVVTVK